VGFCVTGVGVRMVDAGAGVGLLLLAESRIGTPSAARTGGLLVALFTLPHLAGPMLARRLDLARDHRRFLGAVFAAVGVLLAMSTWAMGRLSTAVVGVIVVLAGLGGPMLTGGLSSRLADLVPPHERAQRRAQGLDAAVYGVAATAGPALVASLSGWASPATAVLTLCGMALVSALVVQTLPRVPARDTSAVPRVADVLPLVVLDPPLRRVNYATMVTAAALAGLSVVVLQLAGRYGVTASTAAVLLAVMGAGNLVASLVLSAFPLTGEPDRVTTRQVALLGACLGLCALAPSFGWGLAAFALLGAATAPFVTATFSARNVYAPPAARAQVFVTLAALKITAASAGTALCGLLVGLDPRTLMAAGGAVVLLTAAATVVDRRVSRPAEVCRGRSAPRGGLSRRRRRAGGAGARTRRSSTGRARRRAGPAPPATRRRAPRTTRCRGCAPS
jgi:MFS family permease